MSNKLFTTSCFLFLISQGTFSCARTLILIQILGMLFLRSTYIKLDWNRTVGQNTPSVSMDDARTEVFFP